MGKEGGRAKIGLAPQLHQSIVIIITKYQGLLISGQLICNPAAALHSIDFRRTTRNLNQMGLLLLGLLASGPLGAAGLSKAAGPDCALEPSDYRAPAGLRDFFALADATLRGLASDADLDALLHGLADIAANGTTREEAVELARGQSGVMAFAVAAAFFIVLVPVVGLVVACVRCCCDPCRTRSKNAYIKVLPIVSQVLSF